VAPVELRTVSHERRSGRRPTPVVFVHGAWHGAWCWAEHFLPYFAGHGYSAHAVDLRGHGASGNDRSLRRTRIADFVVDLERVVADFGSPPVVIGHSMGGFVVQKYLETHDAPAAVLLASVPARGGIPASLRLIRRYPRAVLKASTTLSLYPFVADRRRARELFFSADIPQERLRAYHERLQDDAFCMFLDLLAFNVPRPRRVRTPLLVLGGDRDTFFTPREVTSTARAYGTTPTFFPMAHDMMLEDGWQDVADHIIRWLENVPASAERRA
jgi:pimeloyl-ACP methyl ester carboxylesterase